jgi:hypothetical protein
VVVENHPRTVPVVTGASVCPNRMPNRFLSTVAATGSPTAKTGQASVRVFDNNTTNMAVQISGFRSAHKRGPTLGNYEEVSAHHLPQRVRDYVGAYPND